VDDREELAKGAVVHDRPQEDLIAEQALVDDRQPQPKRKRRERGNHQRRGARPTQIWPRQTRGSETRPLD
jgi:hypothetical protein